MQLAFCLFVLVLHSRLAETRVLCVCCTGVDSYDLGEGFGHFGLAVPDVYKTVETVRANGRMSLSSSPYLPCSIYTARVCM